MLELILKNWAPIGTALGVLFTIIGFILKALFKKYLSEPMAELSSEIKVLKAAMPDNLKTKLDTLEKDQENLWHNKTDFSVFQEMTKELSRKHEKLDDRLTEFLLNERNR